MGKTGGVSLHNQLDQLFQTGTITGLTDAELLDRYLTRRDEVAFEALVRMHGPLVLGVCRRLLRDRQEVEDAFQATFLILVRKGPSLRDHTLLANWLYGVAFRVAMRARKTSWRRNAGRQSAEVLDELATGPGKTPELSDWAPILDQELARLPEKYRNPLVLCYLSGRTHEQSAGELGIPVGTVRSRLARGRDLLRRRLERRGVAPSAIAIALGGTSSDLSLLAVVPTSIVRSTLAIVPRFLSGSSTSMALAGSAISAVSLAQGVMTAMFMAQAKVIAVGLLAASVVGVGLVQGVRAVDGQPTDGGPSSNVNAEIPKKDSKASGEEPKSATADADQSAILIGQEKLESRFKELDSKIERLITEIRRTSRPPKDEEPNQDFPSPDLTGFKAQAGLSVPELEAEIGILKRRLVRDADMVRLATELHRTDPAGKLNEVMSAKNQLEDTHASIRRLVAKIERLKQDLQNELGTLKYQLIRKEAERNVEHAKVEVALTKVARNERLNARFKGAVSDEELAKDESELKHANAEEAVVVADVEFVKLRIKNLDYPIKKVEELLGEAKAVVSRNLEPKTLAPTAPESGTSVSEQ